MAEGPNGLGGHVPKLAIKAVWCLGFWRRSGVNKAIVCVLQVLWRADARSTANAERVALCTRCSACMLDLGHGRDMVDVMLDTCNVLSKLQQSRVPSYWCHSSPSTESMSMLCKNDRCSAGTSASTATGDSPAESEREVDAALIRHRLSSSAWA